MIKTKPVENCKKITTLTVLVKCIQISFFNEAVFKQLKVQLYITTLKQKTLHRELSEIASVVEDAQLKEINGDVDMLKDLSVDEEEKNVQIGNVSTGLLLRGNCMRAMEPAQIRASEDGILLVKTKLTGMVHSSTNNELL